jgi:radical SAM superfamily enzyme YgiQ (UPF0313 family)
MHIVFLYWGYENPGIEYLSAVLKKAGHRTSLAFDPALFNTFHLMNDRLRKVFDHREELVDRILDSHPDLIGISSLSEDYGWGCMMAERIKKKKDVPIIFGGKHPTSVPDIVIKEDFIDYVCVGEGEEAMVELADALKEGKDTTSIPNIWAKRNGEIFSNEPRKLIQDLDSLPFADKDIFYDEHKGFSRIYTISSSRGCPHACTYCHNSLLRRIYEGKGPYLRRRSVDNVIEELKLAQKKYNIKKVYFLDEIFVYDIKWLREFVEKYKKSLGLPFGCEVYSTFVNEEVVALLLSAGCLAVDMGIQTISEDLRKRNLRRAGTNEQIKTALKLFKKTKIFMYVGVIIGLPEQTQDEVLEMARFFNRHRPDMILTSWLRYYPRTEIIEIAKKCGDLAEEDVARIEKGKEFTPFVRKGHTFDKDLGKIANLILISPIIPGFLMDFIINRKLYHFFPSSTFLHLNLNSLAMTWVKRIFEGKEKLLYFCVLGQLKFYVCYVSRRIKRSLRINNREQVL